MDSVSESLIQSFYFHDSGAPWQEGVIRLSGLIHLHHQSGIHLLALFFLLEFGIKTLLLRWQFPARVALATVKMGMMIIALLIWRLEGFHFSLFRPLCLFFLRLWWTGRGLKTVHGFNLAGVALLECILRQSFIFAPGAAHFYLAVAGAQVAHECSSGQSSWVKHLRMAIYSWVPIAVFDLWNDHLLNPLTPIFSILSVPFEAWVLYPLGLVSILFTGRISDGLTWFWKCYLNLWVSVLDFAEPLFRVNSAGIVVGAIVTLLLLISKERAIKKWGIIGAVGVAVLSLGLVRGLMPEMLPWRVIQWNVGQGDAALIQKAGRAEMVDAGPALKNSPEQWIRRLARADVGSIDGFLLTHLDLDHRGGLFTLLPVARLDCISEFSRQTANCIRLLQYEWFRSQRKGAKGNEWMAGSVFDLGQGHAYFALGDGDQEQEIKYLSRFSEPLRNHPYRIWKMGHHGSNFSTSDEFLSKLKPNEVWISVGARNPYHHPDPRALVRVFKSRAKIHRTDVEDDLESTSSYTFQAPF